AKNFSQSSSPRNKLLDTEEEGVPHRGTMSSSVPEKISVIKEAQAGGRYGINYIQTNKRQTSTGLQHAYKARK
ncbi:hypothetical protein, partial [Bacteroides heparinolyticus]|uniref:hypothetical protein n=1 Tax=Prevotella heparinolytica TaxID=28113 RepID=UPI00359FD0AF